MATLAAILSCASDAKVSLQPANLLHRRGLLPSSSRQKNVIHERLKRTSRVSFGHNVKAISGNGRLSTTGSLHESLNPVCCISSKGMPSSLNPALSPIFMTGDQGGLPWAADTLPRKQGSSQRVQARTGRSSSLSYPKQTERPEWWWRALAAAPYLIACQISEAGYLIQPLLHQYDMFEELIFYIPGVGRRWFSWFPMLYCMLGFSSVVKNKKWPHFLRYHLVMGMLLETALQIVLIASNWAPLIHFNGSLAVYYWALAGFIYIGILLDGIRSALAGKYFKIPYVADAALIHTNYDVGGFQRPF